MLNKNFEIQNIIENLNKNSNLYLKNINNNINENKLQQINEGVWEKIKYDLSKLGRYKADGKIFGKGKTDKAAVTQIKTIVDKKGNEVIKELDSSIKKTNPKFPNNEKSEDFLKTVLEISAVYDSIVASTNKEPDDKTYLPVDIANSVIEDLAKYTKKYLDVDLAAVYSTMDEEVLSEDDSADVRKKLQGKVGDDAITRDSERMKTLKSNKLPLILAGVGGALGALGWLAQTDWMSNLIIEWFGKGVPGEDAVFKTIAGGAPDAEGFVHWAGEIQGTPIQTGADVQSFVDKFGIENVREMFQSNGGGTVEQQGQQLLKLIGGENAGKSVGELFNADTFGDMKMGRNIFGVSKASSFVAKILVKQAVKAVAGIGGGIAASVAGIGAVLLPLGIGLVATGALVKAMRMKGQKQSRGKTLNDLFQSLQPLKGTKVNPPVIDIDDNKVVIIINNLIINIKILLVFINTFDDLDLPKPISPTDCDFYKKFYDDNKERLSKSGDLTEGEYINNQETFAQLKKLLGNEEIINKFEELLTKLDVIRGELNKMTSKLTGDQRLNDKIEKLKRSPIMKANFKALVNINPDDSKSIEELKDFIYGIVKIVAATQEKHANLLSKLNENQSIHEAAGKDLTRVQFKRSLAPFISGLTTLYRLIARYQKRVKSGAEAKSLNEQIETMKRFIRF